jgi:hypothetical protein
VATKQLLVELTWQHLLACWIESCGHTNAEDQLLMSQLKIKNNLVAKGVEEAKQY